MSCSCAVLNDNLEILIFLNKNGYKWNEFTSLYDNNSYENLLKANSYVYSAFNGEEKIIDESLKENISYMNLVDMMDFSRMDFDKFISLNAKKKIKIESRWDLVKISSLCEI